MNRAIAISLMAGLVTAAIVAPAAAKKAKPGAGIVRTYFLRRADCGGKDRLRLSTKNGTDVACADMQAGLVGDVFNDSGVADTWVSYPAADGVPFALDARKPITGKITLYGSGCAAESVCLPEGGPAAGNARLRVVVVGITTRGKEWKIGDFQESFVISPAEPTHTSPIKTFPDEYFHGDRFTGLRLDVQIGGQSFGPGGISYDDPASFIKVVTLRR